VVVGARKSQLGSMLAYVSPAPFRLGLGTLLTVLLRIYTAFLMVSIVRDLEPKFSMVLPSQVVVV